ncbi:MAG: hypothetical protein EBZ18_07205, partial [Alphaproteobacteria bacterium]|nr:hypothetical protein [Alphaproteobacteria bacterium]
MAGLETATGPPRLILRVEGAFVARGGFEKVAFVLAFDIGSRRWAGMDRMPAGMQPMIVGRRIRFWI